MMETINPAIDPADLTVVLVLMGVAVICAILGLAALWLHTLEMGNRLRDALSDSRDARAMACELRQVADGLTANRGLADGLPASRVLDELFAQGGDGVDALPELPPDLQHWRPRREARPGRGWM